MKAFKSTLFLAIVVGFCAIVVSKNIRVPKGNDGKKTDHQGPLPSRHQGLSRGKEDGECPVTDPDYPILLPDSENCQIYYECNNGVAWPDICDDGFVWQPDEKDCVPEESYECESKSTTMDCSQQEFFENPDDCNSFYQCDDEGNPICRRCALGTVWSQDLVRCDYPHNVPKCKDQENLSESEQAGQVCKLNGDCGNELFANPNDCSTFYQCVSDGFAILQPCAPGTVWWNDEQICDFGTECVIEECEPKPDCSWSGKVDYETLYFPCIEDPARYFECVHDKPRLRNCAPGAYWSDDDKPCGAFWPESKNTNSTLDRPSGLKEKELSKNERNEELLQKS